MEKGSFHPSDSQNSQASGSTARVQEFDEVVKRIPLPNQLPKGLDFSSAPEAEIRSATLEGLISQNEDLMARLTVALRRANQLEEKNSVLNRENSLLKNRFNQLEEKTLILVEKDRMASARGQALHEEANVARSAAQRIEKLYASLYVQAQSFQRRMTTLERYRARIRLASSTIQKKARLADTLREEQITRDAGYTQSISSLEAKLTEARLQMESQRAKLVERDQLFEDKTKIENRLVFEQRQLQQLRTDSQEQIDRLDHEASSARRQLKESLVEAETLKLELSRLTEEVPGLQEETRALREQVESLQTLWSFKQKELTQLEEKNKNLQRLNQSLSTTLNEQRKEVQGFNVEREKIAMQSQEKIVTLQTEIDMLRYVLRGREEKASK